VTASIVAMDLETLLDADLGRRAWDLAGDDDEVRKAMTKKRLYDTDGRSDFVPPAFHQVVATGWARYDVEGAGTLSFAASSVAGASERQCLQAAVKLLEGRPQLVTWNGGGFDLAVLRHRCLIHGVSLAPFYAPRGRGEDDYLYRYGSAHVDLMDTLSGYGAAPRSALHDVAVSCGLPGKTEHTGADVEALVREGKWAELSAYVEQDAVTTLLLHLRFEALKGRLPRQPYVAAKEYFGFATVEVAG
jgi:predicted PolB exonuclease-like 3'-5' exonuclease